LLKNDDIQVTVPFGEYENDDNPYIKFVMLFMKRTEDGMKSPVEVPMVKCPPNPLIPAH
jgi:hypothetical protein